MNKLGLDRVGIASHGEIHRNPSFDELFAHETRPGLEGLEHGVVTQFGAVNVDTGRFTGRSPRDKYLVVEPSSESNIWWRDAHNPAAPNHPLSEASWERLYRIAAEQLEDKNLYIQDGFAGANPETRLGVRVITEVAWQAHFCKNMFIQPTPEELQNFIPDWTILNACKAICPEFEELGLNSEIFVAFHFGKRMTLIGGTWYGGEMKKGIFTVMNYFLPLQGIGSFHCSANMGKSGDTALFFGLSGTGKTTLSTDPHRALIGDDEHGWDDSGVFNFEGGCYAKCIDLSKEKEPDIYHAIKRDALLENLAVDKRGHVDFHSKAKTENTRVSYPINHIENIVKPISRGGHPSRVIFLTCDAFGVLPPVASLSPEQAQYQYLSGYTAKVAGTELGVTEPQATFSACYGAAFLALHPTVYADILGKKMAEHHTRAYLVNTGWVGGPYGVGHRMDLPSTRRIIDAILDGSIEAAEFNTMPIFGLRVPKALHDVDPALLNAREAWQDKAAYDAQARKLAEMFVKNFQKFTNTEHGKTLDKAGPHLWFGSI